MMQRVSIAETHDLADDLESFTDDAPLRSRSKSRQHHPNQLFAKGGFGGVWDWGDAVERKGGWGEEASHGSDSQTAAPADAILSGRWVCNNSVEAKGGLGADRDGYDWDWSPGAQREAPNISYTRQAFDEGTL
jgi:hypothetical protein